MYELCVWVCIDTGLGCCIALAGCMLKDKDHGHGVMGVDLGGRQQSLNSFQ